MSDGGDDLDLRSLDDDELVKQVQDDLYDGLKEEVEEATRILLERGWTPYRVLTEALVGGMTIVGIDFRDGILFVPEVLLAANAMKGGMAILRPLLAETGAPRSGKMVIGTVKGDIHDIGKNLVAMMMEGAGFEVINLGVNNDADKFLAAIKEHNADIIGMSFVRQTEDIQLLQQHLQTLGARHVSTVLKIENRQAFENLPKLLLSGMTHPPLGVMVARGDLAVEVGFERLAEVQEEILWLCEAAHVPVIWATQVLETMAKSGLPSAVTRPGKSARKALIGVATFMPSSPASASCKATSRLFATRAPTSVRPAPGTPPPRPRATPRP